MNRLYSAGVALMEGGARIAALRSDKIRQMLAGHTHAVADVKAGRQRLAPEGYDLWVHAASLGEFEQARPMIERLLEQKPEAAILLTFFSPSGYNVRHNFHPRVQVAYMPFDRPDKVREFLDAASPRMAVFVKYEFWGNYLAELKRRAIPTYIISAIFRPGQTFFRPWGGMFRRMLGCFTHIYVQDGASKKLLDGIGVTNVTVAGDTRFDRVAKVVDQAVRHKEVDDFMAVSGIAPVMVAGSSWPADEDVYIPFLQANPEVRAIIAPHEFNPARIDALRKRLGYDRTAVLSEIQSGKKPQKGHRYLIIDCFGWLSSLYGYADYAYVGGGFGAGLHNINEAAAFTIPVIYGPNNHKFKEAADMAAAGGGFCIHSAADFNAIASRLVSDSRFRTDSGAKAGQYIRANLGATDIIMRDIFAT